ncbi:MAG TPA: tetratricopeptide repeat protein [Candidatus Acidoferrum sp.]|jgi:serine/threonine protein kinase/tetratricopeptide (TPR) repeat protein|nr:tetratricopeptide repeat protein [Candidatus Acidoferrum sp.]
MAPASRECPNCHATNISSSSVCTSCKTPFPLGDATFLGDPRRDENATFLGGENAGDPDVPSAQGWSQPVPPPSATAIRGGHLPKGMRLGKRYEIVQMLGEGGMGAVYKAWDLELDRLVALKVIRPELAVHEEILQRFKQELILARKITQKNVIRIFDLGEADGVKFITMEFIEGKDLTSLIKEKGRLTFEECADVVYQTCTALDAAHSEGVVHRDLKPQNIMVEKSGRIIVMDFGIARTMEQGGGMTQTGALIGTPDYMSPEQVMGEHVDARSDLFTLGIIFYQLLVGQLPYKADTIQGAMFKRTREKPRLPAEVDPGVPALLSDITAKCMQMEPAQRYQNALEIQRDIDSWRGGSTKRIELPVEKEQSPAKKPLSRMTMTLTAAAVIVLVGGGIYATRKYVLPSGAPSAPAAPLHSLAILPFHNATSDAKLDWVGSAMAEMLSTDVGQSASVRAVSSERVGQVMKDLHVTPQADLDASTIGRIANQSNVDTVVSGSYMQLGDRIRIDARIQDLKRGQSISVKEEAAGDKEIFAAVDRLANQIRENLAVSKNLLKELQEHAFKPSTASVPALREYNHGLEEARAGKNAAAAQSFQAAIKEDPHFALAYVKLAQAYSDLGQDEDAEPAAQKAVSLSASLPMQEKYLIQASYDRIEKDFPKAIEAYQNLIKVSPDNTDYLFDLGMAYENTGAYDKAKEMFAKVVELDPKRIAGLRSLGRVQIESGNSQAGLEYLTRAQALSIELQDDAERAQILQAMGVAYSTMQRPDDALKNFQESLEIKTKLGLKKGIADSLQMIGSIYDATGKPDLALKNYNQVLAIRREIGDKQGTANVLSDLGDFYVEHGKYDDALRLFKESLQSQIEIHNDQMQGQVLNNIGNTYFSKGDYENARTYFERALQVREKLKVPSDIADTLNNLAETSMRTGQFEQAQDQYLKVLDLRRSSGDARGAALASSGLGTLFGFQGRFGAAVSAQQDAVKGLAEAKEQGFYSTEVLTAYGYALAQAGRSDEAAKALSDALNAARTDKNQPQIATALSYQGDNAYYRGDLKGAAAAYQESLQAASKSGDAHLVLLNKINLAKLAVANGKFAATANELRALGEEADSLGLKYLSTQCLILRGEALIGTKDYASALKELKSGALRSEKLKLRALLAESQYQWGRALELSGKAADAQSHYDEARRAATEVQKDAQNPALAKRYDLAPIFAEKAK